MNEVMHESWSEYWAYPMRVEHRHDIAPALIDFVREQFRQRGLQGEFIVGEMRTMLETAGLRYRASYSADALDLPPRSPAAGSAPNIVLAVRP